MRCLAILMMVLLAVPSCSKPGGEKAAPSGGAGSAASRSFDASDGFAAINRDDPQRLAELLEQGLDPDVTGPATGETLLRWALWHARVECVRVLASRADVNLRGDDGQMPLHFAVSICDESRLKTIPILVEAGAHVNARDDEGRTPLFQAVEMGFPKDRLDVVSLLIEHGADVNARDNHGSSPLRAAQQGVGREVVADLLRRHGAKE